MKTFAVEEWVNKIIQKIPPECLDSYDTEQDVKYLMEVEPLEITSEQLPMLCKLSYLSQKYKAEDVFLQALRTFYRQRRKWYQVIVEMVHSEAFQTLLWGLGILFVIGISLVILFVLICLSKFAVS